MRERGIEIAVGKESLSGDLTYDDSASGLVIFAHGSGSSRKSPRNRAVAAFFQSKGFATLLFDLLTAEEEVIDERTRHLRFDIDLLTSRLVSVARSSDAYGPGQNLPIGFFGASTGAAAALRAAAEIPEMISAVVSRGGRPDLAGKALKQVKAPTLLIVGGRDTYVIDLNKTALEDLACEKKMEIVAGATHLFEEPGTLEKVANLAADWFTSHLKSVDRP